MPGPAPYQPIQYPEAQSLFFAGQQTIGNSHKFQVDANFPTQYASSTNKDAAPFWVGAAIARHPSGTGFILANSSSTAGFGIGLATLGAPVVRPEIVQLYGLFTMYDWTPVTGTSSLTALGIYYVSTVSGKLTTIAPANAQVIGLAISPSTMQIIPCWCGTSGVVPPDVDVEFFSGQNKDVSTFKIGMPIARHPSGTGLIIADNTTIARSVMGLATIGAGVGFTETIQTSGVFSLANWTAITGAAALVPLGDYFLSSTPGMLTTTPSGTPGTTVQFIGFALSTTDLLIEIQQSILQ